MKDYRKYLKGKTSDQKFEQIEVAISALEDQLGIMLYARLETSSDGIIPVLTFDNR